MPWPGSLLSLSRPTPARLYGWQATEQAGKLLGRGYDMPKAMFARFQAG
jgi:hypothetical protein